MSDLYETLGVARDADVGVIRKAYRKLARKNHPDLNPGDKAAEERFKEISRAWEVLENPERRRNYDEFGAVSLEAGFDAEKARQAREAFGSRFGTGGRPGAEGFGEEFEFGDLDDVLGGFFRGRAERGRGIRMRGADLEAALELDFLDAVRGGEQRLTLGRGGPAGSETITVRIPPGVDTGGRLRIPGKGGPGIGGGPPGDLSVVLRVRPHRVFRREGRDLTFDLPITRGRGDSRREGRGADPRRPRDAHDPARHRQRHAPAPAREGRAESARRRAGRSVRADPDPRAAQTRR